MRGGGGVIGADGSSLHNSSMDEFIPALIMVIPGIFILENPIYGKGHMLCSVQCAHTINTQN